MGRTAAGNIAFRWIRSAGRLLFVVLALTAFVLQGYVTQTHIHNAKAETPISAAKGSERTLPKPYQGNNDPANCPICQQIAQAGHYVIPAWLLLLLVTLAVSTIHIIACARPRYDAVAYCWRSRGPPLN
jgi:hypothetical protein